MFSVSNLARHLKIDPESALREAIGKFKNRFEWIENRLKTDGNDFSDFTIDELEELWQLAKSINLEGEAN